MIFSYFPYVRLVRKSKKYIALHPRGRYWKQQGGTRDYLKYWK